MGTFIEPAATAPPLPRRVDGSDDNFCVPGIAASARDGFRDTSEFGAVVMALAGHDLREPLQINIAAHDVLARGIDGEAERAQLSLIEHAAMQIAESLSQLVELLRVRQASTGRHRAPIPLRPIFSDLAFEFTGPAAAKGIELRVLPASAVVSSNPVLLSSILGNLIHNAINHTPRGGHVLVACRRRGSEAHIEVRDSGIGIPAAELTKVFEAFHRADANRAGGLGLGLFIAKRAAQLLGHRIEVRSASGRGSCFVVVANAVWRGLRDAFSDGVT
jgi:two-component system, OmpR family, phosphate regulon sensor histidine kinase PhoR